MRTRFERFRIRNAGCIAEADMPLDNQGLVFVRGENRDEGGSNGSGKTTIFEVLGTALYDKITKTDRRIKKTDLLNVHNPKDYFTRLDLSVADENYTLKHFRAHSKLGTGRSIFKGTQDITPDDPREAQKLIPSLMGLSWNEYLGSVYLSQKYTHTMIEGTPAQKKEYLSRYFGLDTLDGMIKETTKRINGIPLPDESHIKGMLESVKADLALLGEVSDIQKELNTLLDSQKAIQSDLVNLKVDQSKLDDAKNSEDQRRVWKKILKPLELQLDVGVLKTYLAEQRAALAAARNSLSVCRQRASLLERLEAGGAALVSADPDVSMEDLAASISKLERLLPKVESREGLEQELARLPQEDEPLEIQVLEERTQKWEDKHTEVSSRLSAVKAELQALKKVGDVCFTCQRPISAHEKGEMVDERNQLIEKLTDLIAKAKEALSHYSDRLKVLQRRTDLLSKAESLPAGDSAELTRTIEKLRTRSLALHRESSRLAKIQSLQDQLADLPAVEENEDVLDKQISSLTEHIDLIDDCYRWVLEHGVAGFDAQAASRVYGAILNLESRLDLSSSQLVVVQERMARHVALTEQQDALNKTLNTSSSERQRHRVLKYMSFSLAELKKLGLRDSTQLLSSVLPVYLNQLFPDGSVQLSVTDDAEGFDLMFTKGGHSIPLTLVSGGQAKRVGLAILFSFAKMGRNTTNLLICDEPFRDLDKDGREACFELLRDFNIGTVLVTSHDHDMKASKRYDQVWSVVMENHQSRLYLDG